jgi:dihydrodipicolinate synthase/N-acetylneuraminate lyase
MTDIINPAVEQPTAEQIAQHYKAALDSVALINSTKPENTSDEDWADTIARNKEHLNIMLAKDFWTTENLTPLRTAAK